VVKPANYQESVRNAYKEAFQQTHG
jgi:hypothetical protein